VFDFFQSAFKQSNDVGRSASHDLIQLCSIEAGLQLCKGRQLRHGAAIATARTKHASNDRRNCGRSE
jgi:hypothetical protein